RKIYGGKDPSKVISCYDITKELYSNYRKWNEKSLKERYNFLYEIITPILHIERQEKEYEDDFDLE
ncbi:HNH endonuclease, partial [Helicobacter pylori]|nr:HNH endonuclease [Helicobacter pylori]